ncbi:MAG TPA: SIR2 family protein [Bryobacteraceae bacterium]|nr:SIR2 family protein [Bryobacteraceae bacterium]
MLLTAQHVQTLGFNKGMHKRLRAIFSRDVEPLPVHRFCARLAQKPNPEDGRYPLFLSTNYDGLLERALSGAGIAFDLLYYDESREFDVGLRHTRYDSQAGFSASVRIQNPAAFAEVGLDLRPCVLKIHGSIGRDDLQRLTHTGLANIQKPTPGESGFVISEDDYIRYLACVDWEEFFPATIRDHLAACHYLSRPRLGRLESKGDVATDYQESLERSHRLQHLGREEGCLLV